MCIHLVMVPILLLQERLKYKNAIRSLVVETCLNSSCVNIFGTVLSPANDMTRVMATFSNLQENKNYLLSLHILCNGGVVQRSQQVEISECIHVFFYCKSFSHIHLGTFDVRNISVVPIVTQKCTNVTVTYVRGYEKPANCTVLFKCATDRISPQTRNIINGTSECVSIGEHSAYNIFAIDGDASSSDLISAMYLSNFSINYTVFPATVTNATSGL